MKLACVSILFLCLLTATFSQWILIASFKINQDYIAATLCENRNHPEKHCNGRCFLNKQLNNHEKQDSSTNTGPKGKTAIQLFAEKFTTAHLSILIQRTGVHAFYQHRHSQEYSLSFFQPPQV